MVYGYVRVSSKDQNEARQLLAMQEYKVDKVFCDKQSGKNFDRPEYKKLIRRIKKEDTLVIKSIDRLGRNYFEIIEQWRIISKEKQAYIVVIDMPLLDTRKSSDDVTGALISDIVLQLLSYVAQKEREFIRQRQAEGIAAAKQNGIQFGRPRMQRPEEFERYKSDYLAGNVSSRYAAEQLGISHMSIIRWSKEQS